MSYSGANFEKTGILLGQEARKLKTPHENHYPADNGAGHECLPRHAPARYSAQPAV